jgi:hypothetical protein
MILHPAILALLSGSLLTGFILLFALLFSVRILARWDITSGSECQLILERRTYLISTILNYAFAFQIFSLFLYIYTADNLHVLFTGAMCAAGSLLVNSYGYPVLLLKIVNLMFAGTWLILNYADVRGHDYPLIKIKYALLLFLVPCVLLETVLQFLYFRNLHPDIITSCCGSLFSPEQSGITADIVGLPFKPAMFAFYGVMFATIVSGFYFCLRGRGGTLFSLLSGLSFVVTIASLISFICLYFYDLPTHHCPFCILQKEYRYIGYLLYGTILGGGVCGIGVGALMPFKGRGSMARVIPPLQRRLAVVSISLYLVFIIIVSWRIWASPLELG